MMDSKREKANGHKILRGEKNSTSVQILVERLVPYVYNIVHLLDQWKYISSLLLKIILTYIHMGMCVLIYAVLEQFVIYRHASNFLMSVQPKFLRLTPIMELFIFLINKIYVYQV